MKVIDIDKLIEKEIKMSDNKKIVRLDHNNKIVVENDNAEITSEGTNSNIKGVYEISDDDVAKLLILINNNTLKQIVSYSFMGQFMNTSYTQILTSDEALDKTLSDTSKKYNELVEDYKELHDKYMTIQGNFDSLIEKVKKHNKWSLFNKIKIDELK